MVNETRSTTVRKTENIYKEIDISSSLFFETFPLITSSSHLDTNHVAETTECHEVLHELDGSEALKTIALLINCRIIRGASATILIDTKLKDVVVVPGEIITKGLLEIRILTTIVGKIKNIRACTTLLDTISLPVVEELGIVMTKGSLEIRILVEVEVSIEHEFMRIRRHCRSAKLSKAHVCDHALLATNIQVVPDKLKRRKAGQVRICTSVNCRIISGTGATPFLDTKLKHMVVVPGEIITKGSLEIRILTTIVSDIKGFRASTTFLDTKSLPVVEKLGIIMTKSSLKIRILVEVEVSIEQEILSVDGRFGRNRTDHCSRGLT